MEKSIYSHFVVWSGVAKRSLRSGLVWQSAFCKLESIIHHVWSALESCLSIYGNDLLVGKKKLGFPLEYLAISFYVTNKPKSKESEKIKEKKTAGK